jgi:hypothetical protein
MIIVTGTRQEALARLDVFVGEWVVEARFPAGRLAPSSAVGEGPQIRSRFGWALDGQFLLQRTEVPIPEAPDSLTVVSADPGTGAYTQHYYDSRGVVRLYAMSLADMSAVAKLAEGGEIARGIEAFSARSVTHGGREWTSEDVRPGAGLRLYRATADSHWILAKDGQPDHRVPVPLT